MDWMREADEVVISLLQTGPSPAVRALRRARPASRSEPGPPRPRRHWQRRRLIPANAFLSMSLRQTRRLARLPRISIAASLGSGRMDRRDISGAERAITANRRCRKYCINAIHDSPLQLLRDVKILVADCPEPQIRGASSKAHTTDLRDDDTQMPVHQPENEELRGQPDCRTAIRSGPGIRRPPTTRKLRDGSGRGRRTASAAHATSKMGSPISCSDEERQRSGVHAP